MLTTGAVRALKGAPLSVFIALALVRMPVTAEWLADTTGYTEKPVESALRFLTENGYVTRNGRCSWQIAAGMEQLPLATPALPEAEEPVAAVSVENQTGNIPVCEPLVVVVNSIESRSSLNENLATSQNKPEKIRFAENLAECDRQNIHEPARSRLAKVEGVTPEIIRGHCEACANLGQAIYRIEHHWPAPKAAPRATVEAPATAEEPEDSDAEAERWWAALRGKLAERMPRAELAGYVPAEAAAWREGGALVVAVCNAMVSEVIGRYVPADALDGLVGLVSQGLATKIQFCME